MELKEILKFLKLNRGAMILSSILFGIVGVTAFFYVPTKYYANGSLFVKRSIYPYSPDHFTYEGYYGQQAAMAYTNSVIGLIESEDLRSKAIEKFGLEVNEKNLRKFAKKIKATKTGPQLITLTAKGNNAKEAEELWSVVTGATIETVNKINSDGDPYVSISKIIEKPIVKEGYKDAIVFTALGLCFGAFISAFFLAVKNYLKGKK
jgi:capsular polysaccharide biosynthesis protein